MTNITMHLPRDVSAVIDIERALPADNISLSGGDGRTVVVRLLTYGVDYRVSDDGITWYSERWRPKALHRSLARGRSQSPNLGFEHDRPGSPRTLPVGKASRVWEDGDAVMMEGRIARTSVGDDLLELLREGVVRGVSIEARVEQHKDVLGGREIVTAELGRRVAFTEAPQYIDAEVLAVRSTPDRPEWPRLEASRLRLGSLTLAD